MVLSGSVSISLVDQLHLARVGPTHRRAFAKRMAAGALTFKAASRTERTCLWVRRAMPPLRQEAGRLPAADKVLGHSKAVQGQQNEA